MNKVILAGLALVLVRDCNIGGPRFHGPIQGTWGGENAGLIAFDTTAHVHIGCTAGDTKQAMWTWAVVTTSRFIQSPEVPTTRRGSPARRTGI